MKGKHRRDRRIEPTDLVGAFAIVAFFVLAAALVVVQIGKVVVP